MYAVVSFFFESPPLGKPGRSSASTMVPKQQNTCLSISTLASDSFEMHMPSITRSSGASKAPTASIEAAAAAASLSPPMRPLGLVLESPPPSA